MCVFWGAAFGGYVSPRIYVFTGSGSWWKYENPNDTLKNTFSKF